MTDLAQKVRAAIDETERIAQAATLGPWRYNPAKQWHAPADLAEHRNGEEYVATGPFDAPVCVAVTGPADHEQSMADAEHIARHDPASVLRRCAADRKILDEHRSYREAHPDHDLVPGESEGCIGCGMDFVEEWRTPDVNRCPTLLALAEAHGVEA